MEGLRASLRLARPVAQRTSPVTRSPPRERVACGRQESELTVAKLSCSSAPGEGTGRLRRGRWVPPHGPVPAPWNLPRAHSGQAEQSRPMDRARLSQAPVRTKVDQPGAD